MDERVTLALPRPGPGLKVLLLVVAILGISLAIAYSYLPGGQSLFLALTASSDSVLDGQVWRLFTAGLLTSPAALGHLLFTLMAFYFLSPDLERRWGTWRFIRFVLIAMVSGFLLSIAVDRAIPGGPAMLHPRMMFGSSAAISAIAIAWSKLNAHQTVRLFFLIPVSGRQFFWFTIAMCSLGLVYPGGVPEGMLSPFGGVLVGMLLGGTPSVIRATYLRIKLALLRRQAGAPPVPLSPPASGKSKTTTASTRRAGAPLLRVVQGGADDELRKRRPPKDKRYLN
ncbi:rhomboid family intramembrane serine protease [Pendulispora brunnea]|uniref:Rhomboid family intramembrane serine protease n=1 Tax=Pendulispora brunnea TaxID=2905690 RepID=A0ABZ2KMM3_9BACT